MTGRAVYRDPFGPLVPEVTFLPFGDEAALDAIDGTVAGVITEVIQGEGGIRVAPEPWLRALRQRCTDAGALLIFDEIQSGMGRTGTLFAFEGYGVAPDVLTLAKAFGGGMPLGAFVSSPEVFGTLRHSPPLSHVTTFGGHPVCCAAGLAALDVLIEEDLPARARQDRAARAGRAGGPPARARGARARGDARPRTRDGPTTARVVGRCLDAGVLLGWTLHSDALVRIAPPLTIPWSVLDDALGVIRAALDAEA